AIALFQAFHQHLGFATALFVFFAAGGGQIVRVSFDKTSFGLEVGEGLGGEREQFGQAHFPRLGFNKLDQLSANPLVFVRRADVEAGQFALVVLRINVQSDTGDRVLVDLEDVEVADV